MRFQVPQFIEVEDKIFKNLSIRQLIYLVGGGGLSFMVYTFLSKYLPFFIVIVCIAPIIALALALAFYQVNNRPFIIIIEAALKYMIGNKLYIWHKQDKIPGHKTTTDTPVSASVYVPKISQSKLKDLTWSLDINEVDTLNPGTKETMQKR